MKRAVISQPDLHSPALARDPLNRPARQREAFAVSVLWFRPIASTLSALATAFLTLAAAGAIATAVEFLAGANASAMLW